MENNILTSIEQMLDSRLGKVSNDYLDIQGACFFLGVSKSTMYKLNHKKVIPYCKPKNSKTCYYLREDLIRYIEGNHFKSKQQIDDEVQLFLAKRKGANHV